MDMHSPVNLRRSRRVAVTFMVACTDRRCHLLKRLPGLYYRLTVACFISPSDLVPPLTAMVASPPLAATCS